MSKKTQTIKSYKKVYPQIYSYQLPNRKETDGSQKIGYTEKEKVEDFSTGVESLSAEVCSLIDKIEEVVREITSWRWVPGCRLAGIH